MFGGGGLPIGGSDPGEDVEVVPGEREGPLAFAEGGTPALAGAAQRHRAVADDRGQGAVRPAGRVVCVVAADRGVNRSLTRRGAHEAARRTGRVSSRPDSGADPGGEAAPTRGLVRAAVLLVVRVSSSAVRA